MKKIRKGPGWELRLGDYKEVLADVRCDAVISDPPYSERTHKAQRSDFAAKSKSFSELGYGSWSNKHAQEFCLWATGVGAGWIVVFSDHALQPTYERELDLRGHYVFAPLPQVTRNRSVRLAGDGPACWTTWITVARKRSVPFSRWGALPGAYIDDISQRKSGIVVGAKQEHVMRAIVRDYSRKGNTICDPCAGGGTTLLAAAIEGRSSIGAEIDEETFDKAVYRLSKGYTPDLFENLAA